MDLSPYQGDRNHMGPAEVLRESFGGVDLELATLLGYVSMMSALIEIKIADIAMSVENKPQNAYMASLVGRNHEVWSKRSPLFNETEFERETVEFVSSAIYTARGLLEERNDLLHRVWSQPLKEPWAGYKGVKPDRNSAEQPVDARSDPELWKEFSRDDLHGLIRRMGDGAKTLQTAVGRVTSFKRLP